MKKTFPKKLWDRRLRNKWLVFLLKMDSVERQVFRFENLKRETQPRSHSAPVGNFDHQLGRFLKKKRGERSYEQFGRLLGIRKSTAYKLENGHATARLKTIERICARLKCRLSDIFPDQF